MSDDAQPSDTADTTDEHEELKAEIDTFLRRNFPQIRMHGGEADILAVDPEDGSVHISLGGACSGCGISPMTTQALKNRLPKAIDEISQVHTDTSGGTGRGVSPTPEPQVNPDADDDDDSGVQAPF